jgi:hypothetical protein
MPKRVLCGYGVDVDAVSNWLNTKDGSPVDLANVSRGVFGATVGVDRLLGLFEKHDIKASWFVPAHSLESFPAQMEKVVRVGHELVSATLHHPRRLRMTRGKIRGRPGQNEKGYREI